MAKASERPNPMKITDPNSGDVYTLDFDRETVKFAEQRGFNIQAITERPETGISDLFFYAFRKNHRGVPRDKADRILSELEGLLPEEAARLQELYAASISSLNIEGARKNSRLKVEL